MNAAHFPTPFGVRPDAARRAFPADRLAAMMNEKAASPLETARKAVLDAKARLEEHYDEKIEGALDGYLSLRSRRTSYENGLDAQRRQLEDFQGLTDRRDQLSAQLAGAREEQAAQAPADALPAPPSPRADALERELAGVEREISQLVDQANAHAAGQRKYADYLERTGQDGYAAFEYRGQTRLTRENFAEETSAAIGRMEAGVRQWGERVSSYCEGHGLTPYDMECYLQERRRLSDAYLAARERLAVLSPAAPEARAGQAPAGRSNLDTVEIGAPPQEEDLPGYWKRGT